jgi:prephenate dehydrogenase
MDDGLKTSLADCRVGIIGLGLMGGSIALALQGQCLSISGYDIDPNTLESALDHGIIDSPIDLSGTMFPIDLLILATPVGSMLDWITRLSRRNDSFHLIDLGSTKSRTVDAMQQLPDRISPIGGHPMCGKETAGIGAADAGLYRDCTFVLTPLDRTLPTTFLIAHELIEAIGAHALILDPDRHDRIAAAISHAPYLTSIALIDAAQQLNDDAAWTMAASGFRDSTRLAVSNVTMMLDVLTSNRAAVLESLSRVITSLQSLSILIEQRSDSELREQLKTAQTRRATLFKQ